VTAPRLLLILTENQTMRPEPDVGDLVAFAVEAERAGIDGIMVSEHIVLGPSANAAGVPANPRDYALPGNQDPATTWPSPIVLLSAAAAATQRLVWLEPRPARPGGPVLWFGGSSVHRRLIGRLVRYGSGFNPLGQPGDAGLARLAAAMNAAGRSVDGLEHDQGDFLAHATKKSSRSWLAGACSRWPADELTSGGHPARRAP
jgi:alkanesulfonate monooxygenase SsuD/methylene tetrahydromethanopterin reductase-like flavin-dependent oxidoreductase (luciferase family)